MPKSKKYKSKRLCRVYGCSSKVGKYFEGTVVKHFIIMDTYLKWVSSRASTTFMKLSRILKIQAPYDTQEVEKVGQ